MPIRRTVVKTATSTPLAAVQLELESLNAPEPDKEKLQLLQKKPRAIESEEKPQIKEKPKEAPPELDKKVLSEGKEPLENQQSVDSGIGDLKERDKLISPPIMDAHSDYMSSMATDDDDTMSLISVYQGRVRKRSIDWDNPELKKATVEVSRPASRHSDQSSTSDASKHGNNAAGKSERELTDLTEEENEKNAAISYSAAATDTIYETFKNSETGKVSVRKFLNALTANGIRTTDPRLDESMHLLRRIMKRYGADFDAANTLYLDETEFKNVIRPNALTINRFLSTNFVIPEWNEFCRHVVRLYSICKSNHSGKPSNFIPQLEAYDPKLWGVAVCSVDGQRFSFGDYDIPFCLQAVSRVLNYAIVLNDLGAEKVHSYVGQEPSGRSAKELVLDENAKPHNPMINSGAIVVSAFLKAEERHMADRFDAVDTVYKKMAGRKEFLGFCNPAYLSERPISYRNYALGYFLRENNCLPEHERLNEALELMLQLCAVETSCESLSVMAATLANGGVCPISGEYVIGSNCVRDVLSLMYTNGMNEYSGQFAFHVGLPAKSSISGAIMLVVPNVMGIALWSPPLDARSNSVRGLQFCTELVKVFNFHNYDNLRFTQRKLDPRKMQVESKAHEVSLTLYCAANGDLTALSRFYLQSVDLTGADYDKRTPLHLAAAEGHLHCVKFLVEKARVPSRPVDRWDNTPADDARRHNYPEIADYLENWDLNRAAGKAPPWKNQPAVNGHSSNPPDVNDLGLKVAFVDGPLPMSPKSPKSPNSPKSEVVSSKSPELSSQSEEDEYSGEGSSLRDTTTSTMSKVASNLVG